MKKDWAVHKVISCGGTGTESTLPTNTVQVPITTGTVTDSGSECTGFIGDICRYIYRTGELWALASWPSTWLECWLTDPGPHVWGGEGWGEGCEHGPGGQRIAGWPAATWPQYQLREFYFSDKNTMDKPISLNILWILYTVVWTLTKKYTILKCSLDTEQYGQYRYP